MSPAATLRLRRVARRRSEVAAHAAALREVAADFRRRAEEADSPEAAEPFLEEAAMFEDAARRPLGL